MVALVLADIKIIFFIASPVAMFWIFDQNSLDNIGMFQLLLTVLSQRQGFLYFSHYPTSRSYEATQVGQMTQTDRGDVPYHMES